MSEADENTAQAENLMRVHGFDGPYCTWPYIRRVCHRMYIVYNRLTAQVNLHASEAGHVMSGGQESSPPAPD